jgi:hypothetical protein
MHATLTFQTEQEAPVWVVNRDVHDHAKERTNDNQVP